MVVRVRVWPQEAGEAEEPDKRHNQIVWLSAAQGFQQQAGWIDLGLDAGGGGVMKAEQFYALAGVIYLSPRTIKIKGGVAVRLHRRVKPGV